MKPIRRDDFSFLEQYAFGKEMLTLSSGKKILVKKYFLIFQPWKGKPIENSYGNKTIINWEEEPVFAELAILRLFKENGWNGVWVDSYRRNFRIGLPDIVDPVQLPVDKQKLIDSIKAKTGVSGGCWDVFVWKGRKVLFVELKRQKKDKLQDSQLQWLGASIGVGLRPSDFAIIEWDLLEELTGV